VQIYPIIFVILPPILVQNLEIWHSNIYLTIVQWNTVPLTIIGRRDVVRFLKNIKND
jgi:hypothetical protein